MKKKSISIIIIVSIMLLSFYAVFFTDKFIHNDLLRRGRLNIQWFLHGDDLNYISQHAYMRFPFPENLENLAKKDAMFISRLCDEIFLSYTRPEIEKLEEGRIEKAFAKNPEYSSLWQFCHCQNGLMLLKDKEGDIIELINIKGVLWRKK